MDFPQRVFLLVLAVAFAATAAFQTFLAASVSEWWPIVLAVVLALAALWCLAAAAGTWDERRWRRLR